MDDVGDMDRASHYLPSGLLDDRVEISSDEAPRLARPDAGPEPLGSSLRGNFQTGLALPAPAAGRESTPSCQESSGANDAAPHLSCLPSSPPRRLPVVERMSKVKSVSTERMPMAGPTGPRSVWSDGCTTRNIAPPAENHPVVPQATPISPAVSPPTAWHHYFTESDSATFAKPRLVAQGVDRGRGSRNGRPSLSLGAVKPGEGFGRSYPGAEQHSHRHDKPLTYHNTTRDSARLPRGQVAKPFESLPRASSARPAPSRVGHATSPAVSPPTAWHHYFVESDSATYAKPRLVAQGIDRGRGSSDRRPSLSLGAVKPGEGFAVKPGQGISLSHPGADQHSHRHDKPLTYHNTTRDNARLPRGQVAKPFESLPRASSARPAPNRVGNVTSPAVSPPTAWHHYFVECDSATYAKPRLVAPGIDRARGSSNGRPSLSLGAVKPGQGIGRSHPGAEQSRPIDDNRQAFDSEVVPRRLEEGRRGNLAIYPNSPLVKRQTRPARPRSGWHGPMETTNSSVRPGSVRRAQLTSKPSPSFLVRDTASSNMPRPAPTSSTSLWSPSTPSTSSPAAKGGGDGGGGGSEGPRRYP